MSYEKLNVLHIHLIDAESIPIDLKRYPQFGEKGRWHANAHYTQEELKELVNYAFMRGIAVIAEFDLPGHAYAWGYAYPQTRSTCHQLKKFNMNNYPIQPTNNLTYGIIDAIVEEMSPIFTNEYMHFGGDELVLGCWQNDEQVIEFLKSHPEIKNMQDLWGHFQVQLEKVCVRIQFNF
jgi:hexosaminidase